MWPARPTPGVVGAEVMATAIAGVEEITIVVVGHRPVEEASTEDTVVTMGAIDMMTATIDAREVHRAIAMTGAQDLGPDLPPGTMIALPIEEVAVRLDMTIGTFVTGVLGVQRLVIEAGVRNETAMGTVGIEDLTVVTDRKCYT